jgi:hypothetical protein
MGQDPHWNEDIFILFFQIAGQISRAKFMKKLIILNLVRKKCSLGKKNKLGDMHKGKHLATMNK